MSSTRFQQLLVRIEELKTNMLPEEFSPTGEYSEKEKDHARGYRLLVHAEIESYLEDISRNTITKAISDWKRDRIPSIKLISFLACFHSSWDVNDDLKNEEIIRIAKSRATKNSKESVDEIIDIAQTQFIKIIKDNNGVKENNFNKLIAPIGIDPKELDSTWITNLHSFGAKRGDVAHNTKTTTGDINPKDEYISVTQLVQGLNDLDVKISSL